MGLRCGDNVGNGLLVLFHKMLSLYPECVLQFTETAVPKLQTPNTAQVVVQRAQSKM